MGYGAHLTETRSREGPSLITHVGITSAMVPDPKVLGPMHGYADKRNLLPR